MTEASMPFEHRGTRAIQRMVEFAPSTGGLALWVGHRDLAAEPEARAVMTDGHTVFYGSAFEKLTLAEQTGLVAHEVLPHRLASPATLPRSPACVGRCRSAAVQCLRRFDRQQRVVPSELAAAAGCGGLPRPDVVARARPAAGCRGGPDRLGRGTALPRHRRSQATRPSGASTGRQQRNIERENQRARFRGQTSTGDGSIRRRAPPRARMGRARRRSANSAPTVKSIWCRPRIRKIRRKPKPNLHSNGAERILRGHAGDGIFSMLRTLIADLPRSRTAMAAGVTHPTGARPVTKSQRIMVAPDTILYRQPGARWPEPAIAVRARLQRSQDRAAVGRDRRLYRDRSTTI